MKRFLRGVFVGVLAIVAGLGLVACALHVSHSEQAGLPDAKPQGALRIASYNAHYIILSQDTGPWSVADWDRRKAPMQRAFQALNADLVAFQEMESWSGSDDGSTNQARNYLAELNPDYGIAAVGDVRLFPSTQPFFYRKKRLQPIDQGWFFFSDTPDVIYSQTFNGSYPAFASWVQFEDRETGARFRIVNVHFEYSSRSNRLLSAELVRDRMTPWVNTGETVFLVGDLNARHGAKTMRILEEAGLVFDRVPGATYHLNRGVHLFGAIDHLARTPEVALVAGPEVLQRKFEGVWPSDHHPVYADYRLP